jgi:BlaI family transcriptional regulator, penicillinase repressor
MFVTKYFVDDICMSNKPTDAELKVLQILWKDGPQTVRFVNDCLNVSKKVGYTTTLKIMQIMLEKNMLKRRSEGRTHVYATVEEQEETQKLLIKRMVDTAFNGSASRLVMQALGNYKASPEELKEIKDLISKMEEDES